MNTCPPVACAGCGINLGGLPLKYGRPLWQIGWVHYGGEWGMRCADRADPAHIDF